MIPDKSARIEDGASGPQGGKRLAAACLAAYMALLAFASLMPVGRDSALAATETRRILNNLLHVPAYGALAFGWIVCLDKWTTRASRWKSAVAACCLAVAYGGLLEAAQALVPGRAASAGDLLLNTVGVACGCAFMFFWKRRSRSFHG